MRKEALDFPKSVLIETCNRCQGECKFCPYQEIRVNEKTTYLDFDRYKQLIDEMTYHPVKRISLFENNEPLIDKRIYEFVNYAHDKLPHVELTLSTNGRLLTKEVIDKLYLSGLTTLYVSIPTVDDEHYKEVMGNDISKIVPLLTSIEDDKLIKMIRIAVPKTKYFDINEFKKIFDKYLICAWDIEYKKSWNIDKKIYDIADIGYTGPCDRPLDQMIIKSNGDVSICCRDWQQQNIVGNIYINQMYDIWHNVKMKKIQDSIAKQDYDDIECCRDCNMNIKFYRKERGK